MRVVILTGGRHGPASLCLPALAADSRIQVVQIVHSLNQPVARKKRLGRNIRKAMKIGPLGAINGVRMRKWYDGPPSDDLYDLAACYKVPIESSPRTNDARTQELFRACGADLGLSLGNGYISAKVFRIPQLGMINIHCEVLPAFQGAASVIWPIFEGLSQTGFTLHQIDEQIDTGPILYQEAFPLRFGATLAETVRINWADIWRRVPPAMANVVAEYPRFREQARPQGAGGRYTTPTIWQYLRMLRQHRRLRAITTEHSRESL